jgi:hypothetical protein
MADAVRVGMARGSISEVAPRRQHVGAAARRRAGRTGSRGVVEAATSAARSRSPQARMAVSSGRQRERLHRRLVGRLAKDVQAVAMLSSLMSQSWASSLAMACRLGSPLSSSQSAANLRSSTFDDRLRGSDAGGRGRRPRIFLDDAFQLGQRAAGRRRRAAA